MEDSKIDHILGEIEQLSARQKAQLISAGLDGWPQGGPLGGESGGRRERLPEVPGLPESPALPESPGLPEEPALPEAPDLAGGFGRERNPPEAWVVSTWKDVQEMLAPISWDWPLWAPRGFITMLASEAGLGKSSLMLRIAACYLRGLPWPDGTPFTGEQGKITWAETEAGHAMNLQRALSLGVNLADIVTPLAHPLDGLCLDRASHREELIRRVEMPEVKAIFVDSFRGMTKQEEDRSDLMGVMVWLAELARDMNKPFYISHHLRKAGMMDVGEVKLDRLRGSSAIVQPVRMVWALDCPSGATNGPRRLSVIKSNLARIPKPIGMVIGEENGVFSVEFGPAPEGPKIESQVERAMAVVEQTLADGPKYAVDMETVARVEGISWRTMMAAKRRLGVRAEKEAGSQNGRWRWLPPMMEA